MESWLREIKVFSFDMGFTLFNYIGLLPKSLNTQRRILLEEFERYSILIPDFDEFWETFLRINTEVYQNHMKNLSDSKYMYERISLTFQALNLKEPPIEAIIKACAPMFNYKYSYQNLEIVSQVKALFDLLKHHKYRIILISNFPERTAPDQPHFVETVLDHYHLRDYFDLLMVSGEIQISKPHPQIFETALSKMKIEPSEMVHIGDDFQADIKGARELGIPAIWLSHREKTPPNGGTIKPTMTFHDLNEFYSWITSQFD